MASSEGSKGAYGVGVLLGLLSALLVLCVLSAVGFAFVQARRAEARKGWNTVPILVAAVDVAPGERLVVEKLSQRSIPEQFVTSSVVKPDSASYVLNGTVRARLYAGDPVRWADVDDGEGKVPVLFAARDIAPGTLVKDDVTAVWVPSALTTRSWVFAEDELPLGRTVVTPFKRGDPLLWTHFPPQSAGQ